MSDHPDKENETFHMYFNLANRLLDTMYHKIAPKTAPFDASWTRLPPLMPAEQRYVAY